MSLQFEAIGSLGAVPMIGDSDSLVVMTTSGPRRILKSSLTAGLAAQIPAISEWDGASTEAVSAAIQLGIYGFRSVMPSATAATTSEATLDNTNFNAAFLTPGSISTTLRQVFRFNGTLPKTGKYWLTINADFSGLSSNAAFVLYTLADIGTMAQLGPGARSSLLLTPSVLNPLVETGMSTPGNIDVSASPLKSVLVCFDIDNNQLSFSAVGTTKTITYPASAPLAGRALVGGISAGTADTSKNIQINFNNTNATTSPVTIPGGFVGLQLVNATLPTYATQGSGIRSTTPTSYHGQQINAYDLYIITSDRLALVPDIYKTPQIALQNSFAKPQVFCNWQLGYDSWNWISSPPTDAFAALSASGTGTLSSNILIGTSSGAKMTSAVANLMMGNFVLANVASGSYNVALGASTLGSAQSASYNTSVGVNAGGSLIGSTNNVLLGYGALHSAGHNGFNVQSMVAVGYNALGGWRDSAYDGTTLASATVSNGTVAVGTGAAGANGSTGAMPLECVAVGDSAMSGTSATYSVAIGASAMLSDTGSPAYCVAIGVASFQAGAGNNNTALGYGTMTSGQQSNSVAVGYNALSSSIDSGYAGTSTSNTAIGAASMQNYSGKQSTGVGSGTLASGSWTNATALGYQATVTGDNQVQLGNSTTTTYVYGTVQSRSDARDKTEVRNTLLGMKFLLALRPVDYKWDMRDDYIDYSAVPKMPVSPGPEPLIPAGDHTTPGFSDRLVQWKHQHDAWAAASQKYRLDMDVYTAAMIAWNIKNDISKVVHDGTHARKRFHHGFIAQEVKATADKLGIDFGGYQDHSLKSGKDVKSIGYEEMVAPLVKGFQELHTYLHSEEYAGYLLDKMVEVQKKRQAAAAT